MKNKTMSYKSLGLLEYFLAGMIISIVLLGLAVIIKLLIKLLI